MISLLSGDAAAGTARLAARACPAPFQRASRVAGS